MTKTKMTKPPRWTLCGVFNDIVITVTNARGKPTISTDDMIDTLLRAGAARLIVRPAGRKHCSLEVDWSERVYDTLDRKGRYSRKTPFGTVTLARS
jgi:hypothetical protein